MVGRSIWTRSRPLALSTADYQPMGVGAGLLGESPPNAHRQAVQRLGSELERSLRRLSTAMPPRGRRSRRVIEHVSAPLNGSARPARRRAGDRRDAAPHADPTLGRFTIARRTPKRSRLFAALAGRQQRDPGLSQADLARGRSPRNADAATWGEIHADGAGMHRPGRTPALYQLLGSTTDEALARRALDFAITDEPGKTISAGIISAVAEHIRELALDFVLAHLEQVNQLVDFSGRHGSSQRLASGSDDAERSPSSKPMPKRIRCRRPQADRPGGRPHPLASWRQPADPVRRSAACCRRHPPWRVDRTADFAIGARSRRFAGAPSETAAGDSSARLNLQPRRDRNYSERETASSCVAYCAAPSIQPPRTSRAQALRLGFC